MYQAKRTDYNQAAIVAALRKAGCTVTSLHEVGRGCPDIVVGYQGRNYLLEIKNPQTKGKLNDLQIQWHSRWRGQVATVWTVEDAFRVVGVGIQLSLNVA
jgi:Holliday junction resolvase